MRASVSKYKHGLPRFGAAGQTYVSECTVRKLTDEERERLDKLLGPPKKPLTKSKIKESTKPVAPQFVDENKLELPDTVYVAQFENRRTQVYHLYQDCGSGKSAEPRELREAKGIGLRLCAFCKIRYARERREGAK
ncbi:hypothetical protein DNHGIG_14860 [Collibacillus ludicampi]|jgi:hypothetical protein|uniref:Uncharacterized protein n=1 Tax=Collibacillus ludicampi TaxID=2771369 RepID=A0AAV4LDL4_9BACL|nr:hypothetical protein [Collibacillus ludicampi]GIM45937.1 hypothetical protein DNHGIG_14860 [Collibacillus ludicampi]